MTQRTRIKLCGLSRPEDIQAAVQAGADAIGLVFYDKSPRYLTAAQAGLLLAGLPPYITAVGLFVNASPDAVQDVLRQAPLGALQFHGDESAAQCAAIAALTRRPYTCALRVKPATTAADLLECDRVHRQASPYFSGLLLDTFVDAYGGSGKVFDWSIVPAELAPRVVLSGGLNVHNVTDAVRLVRPHAVDVSSGIEREKGVKDAGKMQDFVRAVQAADAAQAGHPGR
ncbi:MAG: N-(5phosphoribosyl)anthranilate isomerase family protein [Paucimonas sp.]|nr:N-(5phosphoribosyl)anthranilate isomerase family protein [Paucimonas sp.]